MLQGAQKRQLLSDVQRLGLMLKEVASGKAVKPINLSLSALNSLSQGIARLPRRNNAQPADSSNSASASTSQPAAASQPSIRPSELIDPLFQDTDILDIDILDEDQDLLGLEQQPAMSQTQTPPNLPADIFRA